MNSKTTTGKPSRGEAGVVNPMKSAVRLALSAFIAFTAFWCAVWLFSLMAPLRDFQRLRLIVCCSFSVAAALLCWRKTASIAPGLASSMFKGAAITGGIGFAAGFFGPIILTPGANQGPLLGIFITGPLGLLLGAIAGALRWGLSKPT